MGVQLALAENDWNEAETLLTMREYPPSLSDQVRNLQTQISEIKAQEGKIVINFAPGTRQIPLTAVLNGRTYQQFIVDTGASLVTIPRSTAEELGLDVDGQNPVRKIYTAGGVKYAPEVTLSSITVEGWEVADLKALVLDLPNSIRVGIAGNELSAPISHGYQYRKRGAFTRTTLDTKKTTELFFAWKLLY